MIVVEEPAEPSAAADSAARWSSRFGCDRLILDALVIPLTMVVRCEFRKGSSQMGFPEHDQALQAFNPGVRQRVTKCPTPFRVSVADQHAMTDEHSVAGVGQGTSDLEHECLIGRRSGSQEMYAP